MRSAARVRQPSAARPAARRNCRGSTTHRSTRRVPRGAGPETPCAYRDPPACRSSSRAPAETRRSRWPARCRRDARAEPSEDVQPHHLLDAAGFVAKPIAARQHRPLHRKRNPGVRPFTDGLAEEPFGRDADDRQHARSKRDRPAEHLGIAAEPLLPEVVADDGHRRGSRGRLVCGLERVPQDGRHAERSRIRRRNHAECERLQIAAGDARLDLLQRAVGRRAAPRTSASCRTGAPGIPGRS